MKTCNHNNCFDAFNRICIPDTNLPRVVVVGGGFAGLAFIKKLKNKPVQLILIDKGNYHQFIPLLYQVATSGLEPDSIVFPFRKLFRNYNNALYRMAEVKKIDTQLGQITTNIGTVKYDFLVLATGSVTNFFGNESVEKQGFGLKSVTDALDIRSYLLQNLEKAEITCNREEGEVLSSVAIVGGGPAGVEMAGALAEFKKYVVPKDYPELEHTKMKIYLIEAAGKLLQDMPERLSEKTHAYLKSLDVNVMLNIAVDNFDNPLVKLNNGHIIQAGALIWTAGIKGAVMPGLDPKLLNRQGRIRVDHINRITGYKNIFAIGDIALLQTKKFPKGHPMVAQVAIQQGRNLAANLLSIIYNQPKKEFRYIDKGSMATIGKKKAVAKINNWQFSGFFAWFLWSFVHLMSIIGVRNKVLIGINWFWSYFTYDKGNRVIIRKYSPLQKIKN
jgi:NADH dehydrogenase